MTEPGPTDEHAMRQVKSSVTPESTPGPPAAAAGAGIRPSVAAVLVVGALLSIGAVILDPPPEVRYGLVGAMGVLYFLSKVRHWL